MRTQPSPYCGEGGGGQVWRTAVWGGQGRVLVGGRERCGSRLQGRARVGTHLREATVEAGGPATLGAAGPTAQALAAQDAVAALGVGAPGQVGTALHVATQEGLLVLWGRRCHEVRAWLSGCHTSGPPARCLSAHSLGLCTGASPRRRYLGDDLWRGDDGADEGPRGLGGAVGNGAGAVQHKVLLNSSCQVLLPARLGGTQEQPLRGSVGAAQVRLT